MLREIALDLALRCLILLLLSAWANTMVDTSQFICYNSYCIKELVI